MIFSEKMKNLAQKLQKSTLLVLLSVFFIFPATGLFADEADLPVIIPNDKLLTPIELRDGLVFEVVVVDERKLTLNDVEPSKVPQVGEFVFSGEPTPKPANISMVSNPGMVFLISNNSFSEKDDRRDLKDGFVFESGQEHFSVKSIASPGLFCFLGICLSRSELPSKNFSMLCENSLPKSMTRRSANDWKFLWQPVRTTSLWLLSTSSSKMLRTLTPRPSRNLTHSMSDISSIWSNATDESRVTFYPEGMKTELVVTVLPSLQRNSQQFSPNPNTVSLNLQVL